jgi:hypothetical protein
MIRMGSITSSRMSPSMTATINTLTAQVQRTGMSIMDIHNNKKKAKARAIMIKTIIKRIILAMMTIKISIRTKESRDGLKHTTKRNQRRQIPIWMRRFMIKSILRWIMGKDIRKM